MLEILSHDLHGILSEAALFAHKTPELPTINSVLLEFDGTNLVAIATDRFKMAVSRVKLYDVPEDQAAPFKTSIRLDEVGMLVSHLKTPRALRNIQHVKLQVGADTISVADGLGPNIFNIPTPYGNSELTFTVTPVAGPFPNWRPLMSLADAQDVGCIALDPHHLAPFFKVATMRGDHRMRLRFRGPAHAALVQMGSGDFAGLLMPIRLTDDDLAMHPDWLQNMIDAGQA